MKLNAKRISITAGATLLALGLVACSKKKKDDAQGESSVKDVDGTVTAGTLQLQLADTLNVIPAKTAESAALTEVDDARARINYRVREVSTDGLRQVQSIMCFVAQVRYAEMANLGPYVALVNEDKCFNEGDSSKGSTIKRVKVESTREEGKALVVKLWLPGDEHEPDGMQIVLQVAEGASETNPVGIFRLQFGGKGYIESTRNDSGEIEVVFLEDDTANPDERWSMKMAVRLGLDESGDVAGGRMVIASDEKFGEHASTSEFSVVFDHSVINRAGTTNRTAADACLSRDEHTSQAWNYNLYKADGSLFRLNSGFPIEWEEDGATKQGYASYWGISGQNGDSAGPASGATVYQVDYSSGDKVATKMTVKTAPGKLYKHVKKEITLGELTGVELQQWTMGGELIAKWNGSKFVKVATVNRDNGNEKRTPVNEDLAADDWGGYRFHVMSLGGEIYIPADQAVNSYKVSYFQRTMVSGTNDAPTGNLVCFDRCIDVNADATAFGQQSYGGDGVSGPFYETTGYNGPSTTAKDITAAYKKVYEWDSALHNLTYGGEQFVLPPGLSSDNQMSQQSGPLVPETDWNDFSDKNISPYDLQQQVDVYYVFESGPQSWSQYAALIDESGKIVQFDQPINFTYVHSQANDLNGAGASEFYGQTFSLQYGGPGNLWGFPYERDEQTGYTNAKFGLAPGAELTGGYTVVPVEVEQVLAEVDAEQCAAVPLEDLPELPSTPPEAVDNGEEPADDTPVKVIDGEVI